MTTARAVSSVMPSVALAPRRAAVPQRVAHQEVEAQEAVLHEAAARVAGAILRGNRTVVAVAPAVTTMEITIHHVAVAEAEGDNVLWDTLRVEIYQKSK